MRPGALSGRQEYKQMGLHIYKINTYNLNKRMDYIIDIEIQNSLQVVIHIANKR